MLLILLEEFSDGSRVRYEIKMGYENEQEKSPGHAVPLHLCFLSC